MGGPFAHLGPPIFRSYSLTCKRKQVTSMNFTAAETMSSAVAIRQQLLAGHATIPVFAEAIGKTVRTVYAYLANGMPVTHIGKTPYIPVEEAGRWLRSQRVPKQMAPRRPGRPRRAA